jgi:hypothetical protein
MSNLKPVRFLPKQVGYETHSPKWFKTSDEELRSLIQPMSKLKYVPIDQQIIDYVANGTDHDVSKVYVMNIEARFRRSRYDNSKVIVAVININDELLYIAKRFNNNQYFKIDK